METVTNDDVTKAFNFFCQETGLDDNKMSSCFELTMFVGFSLVNQFRYRDNDKEIAVGPHGTSIIAALNGPHRGTVVKVWKIKRYSLLGRLKAAWLKPLHRIGFLCVSFVAFIREAWS